MSVEPTVPAPLAPEEWEELLDLLGELERAQKAQYEAELELDVAWIGGHDQASSDALESSAREKWSARSKVTAHQERALGREVAPRLRALLSEVERLGRRVAELEARIERMKPPAQALKSVSLSGVPDDLRGIPDEKEVAYLEELYAGEASRFVDMDALAGEGSRFEVSEAGMANFHAALARDEEEG